jgi:hypothetical protein
VINYLIDKMGVLMSWCDASMTETPIWSYDMDSSKNTCGSKKLPVLELQTSIRNFNQQGMQY